MFYTFKGETVRVMTVNVINLCNYICESALEYFNVNQSKLKFAIDVIPNGYKPVRIPDDANTDPIAEMLNEKIRQSGENVQLKGSVLKVLQNVSTAEMIENNKIFRGDKIIAYKMSFMPHREEKKVNTDDKAKEEHRFRCFFGRAFKDSPYKAYKEDIVKAVLASKTKMELNNSLMKLLPGEAVKEVLKNLKPYIKDWPGQ